MGSLEWCVSVWSDWCVMYLLYQYPHHLVSVFVFVSVSVVVMIEVVAVVDRLTN